MTALSVNLNKIAVLRNSRGGSEPDVLAAGVACIDAGAHGLTVHPRPDARHIRSADVHTLNGAQYGQLLISRPDDPMVCHRAIEYLKERGLTVEDVRA